MLCSGTHAAAGLIVISDAIVRCTCVRIPPTVEAPNLIWVSMTTGESGIRRDTIAWLCRLSA
jgi:hypothetical protein